MKFPPINLWSLPRQLRDYMTTEKPKCFGQFGTGRCDLCKGSVKSECCDEYTNSKRHRNDPTDHQKTMSQAKDPGAHYRYEYKGIKLDPYRIADIYKITSHAQFSALKKILVMGGRGHKDTLQDIDDAINALQRLKEIIKEDDE